MGASDPPADPNIGRIVAERYRVDAVIAKGGMGAVYRGEHVHMRKKVALKLLHADTEDLPALVARFERESIVGAHARHHNVGMATDFGKDKDGSYYLVMEYIEGVTLRSIIDRGPLALDRAVSFALQIARGLQAIHELEIVHRDLNPRNVMVTKGDIIKLIDFGFAQVPLENFDESDGLRITSMGEVFGTIGFIAPEAQYGMVAVEKPADLYALGVIFYEMLTGQHPFEVKEHKRLFRAHTSEDIPPPSSRAPRRRIPPDLERVIMCLLEKRPDDRYASAAEAIAAIEEAAASAAASTPPPVIDTYDPPSEPPEPTDEDDAPLPFSEAPPAVPMKTNWVAWVLVVFVLAGVGAVAAKKDWRDRALAVFQRAPPTSAPSVSAAPTSSIAPATTRPSPRPSASTTETPAPPERPTEVKGVDADGWTTALAGAVSTSDFARAKEALFALAKIDPSRLSAPENRRMAASAVTLIARGDAKSSDEVFSLLTSKDIGPAGPDVLFRMVTHHGGSRGAKRAGELLAREDVLALASPALRVAVDMRKTACGSRADLFDRAIAEGDQRVLDIMVAMDRDGCHHTCCMRYNHKLDDAVRKLRERIR